jgi:hypothetical protein
MSDTSEKGPAAFFKICCSASAKSHVRNRECVLKGGGKEGLPKDRVRSVVCNREN